MAATAPAEPAAAPAEQLVVPPGGRLELGTPAAVGAQRYEVALDGGLLRPIEELQAPLTGRHWLAVAARDAAGNLSPLRWVLLLVDGEPPQVGIEVEPAPVPDVLHRLWVPPGATARAWAEDQPAGVREVGLAGAGEPVTAAGGEVRAPLPLAGEVDLRAWAHDRVGNRAADVRQQLLVDAEPPRGSIRVVGPQVSVEGRLVVGPAVRLEAPISDPETGLDRWTPRLNGEEVSLQTWQQQQWSAGRYRAEVDAVDRVGNRAQVGPLYFEVDAAAPEIRWRLTSAGADNDAGETFYRPPVTLEVAAADSAGVADVAWSDGGERWTSFGAPAGCVTLVQPSVQLRAADRVGNEHQEQAAWRLDQEPPRLVLLGPGGQRLPPDTPVELEEGVQLRILAEDDGAGVASQEAAVDGERWVPTPHEFVLPTWGDIRLEARATDRLGHRARAEWRIRVRRPEREPRSERQGG